MSNVTDITRKGVCGTPSIYRMLCHVCYEDEGEVVDDVMTVKA